MTASRFPFGRLSRVSRFSSWINRLIPGIGHSFMLFVGIVEIIAGLLRARRFCSGRHDVADEIGVTLRPVGPEHLDRGVAFVKE